MGASKFEVKTFNSFSHPVIHFKKQVWDENQKPLRINGNKEDPYSRAETEESINIQEIYQENGERKDIRHLTKRITIAIYPSWIDKNDFDEKIEDIVFKNEKPEEVLMVNVRLYCPKLNYIIDSKNISLEDISNNKSILFSDINLEDISEKITIKSELLRVKSSNPTDSYKAFAKWTILAHNHDINFYVDEIENIGQNALEIEPGETGEYLFKLNNMELLGVEPPSLIYNKKFIREFTNGDNSLVIQTLLMSIGLPYSEALLKWICFGKASYNDEQHYVIIRFLSRITEIHETDFKDIIEDASEEHKQDFYLRSTNQLFKNIQIVDKGWNYFLKKFLNNE